MQTNGKPKDLIPGVGKTPKLTAPKQGDLTPEAAGRILRSAASEDGERGQRQDQEDPISSGRGKLEIAFYGVMLLFVMGYQIFSHLERESDGRLMERPEVTALAVEDRVQGDSYRVEGNRLEKPSCDEGEAGIDLSTGSVEGPILGNLRLVAESANGEWQIEGRALPFGGARIEVDVRIHCEGES